MTDMVTTAALIYAGLCGGVVVFQLCLIFGAPWGPLTQGGTHPGALPASGRMAAAASVCLLIAMASAIYFASGSDAIWPRWTGWAVVGIQTLSTLLNWITPSLPERRLWGPTTTVMLAACLTAMMD